MTIVTMTIVTVMNGCGLQLFFFSYEHLLLRARRDIYRNVMIHSPELAVASFHLWVLG